MCSLMYHVFGFLKDYFVYKNNIEEYDFFQYG